MSARTLGPVTTVTGTVSTSAIYVLAQNTVRGFLLIQNPDAAKSLSFTVDGTSTGATGGAPTTGTTPVLNVTHTLGPLGSMTFDSNFVPTGSVNVIGSASGTPYAIMWF